mmetsp:Transcript_34289/g.101873  ORF Transcript_34289/g.101873 Transcript_34289/m.101873 type:complete len:373 (+) Transcript_34289:308-1426(+)
MRAQGGRTRAPDAAAGPPRSARLAGSREPASLLVPVHDQGRNRRPALRDDPGRNDGDVVVLAAGAVVAVAARVQGEGHLRVGVQRPELRSQDEGLGDRVGVRGEVGEVDEVRERRREGAVHDAQDLVIVHVVPEAVGEHQDQVSRADLRLVQVAVRSVVLVELRELARERRWQSRELVRAVPAVLLLIRLEDYDHPVRAFAQQHEARVAEIGNTDLVALQAQRDHGRRTVCPGSVLARVAGRLRTLVDLAHKVLLAGAASRHQGLVGALHEVGGVISCIHAVTGELHHAANTICDSHGRRGREVRVLRSPRAVLLAQLVGAGLHDHVDLTGSHLHVRQRVAVEAQPQLRVEQLLEDVVREAPGDAPLKGRRV